MCCALGAFVVLLFFKRATSANDATYAKNFHAHLPGFEGFREGGRDSHIIQDVIKKDLTKYLSK